MNNAETIAQLCSLRNRGSKFGLERMRRLCDELGTPQKNFAAIHIAGTNGKGSTAAMCEAILRGNGLRVGLYTSPHLVRLGERIQVDRIPLSDDAICAYTRRLYAAARVFGQPGDAEFPSFFELMTAMAFLHFAESCCDVAVIETGLGGRLDASNILTPDVCAITSIGLDHCDILGNTLEAIAIEKAGIIKTATPLVLGSVPENAECVIREIASGKNAPVVSVRERFGKTIDTFPQTNLVGDHQRRNAATALLATQCFFEKNRIPLPKKPTVFLKNVAWAARWETKTLDDGRTLIIDVAHNAECASALDALLHEHLQKTGVRPTIIVGVLGSDRAAPIMRVLASYARELVLVRPSQERASSLDELQALIPENFDGIVRKSEVVKIFPGGNVCSLPTPDNTALIVAGSCYLAGEVLAALAGTPGRSETFLQDKLPAKKN